VINSNILGRISTLKLNFFYPQSARRKTQDVQQNSELKTPN